MNIIFNIYSLIKKMNWFSMIFFQLLTCVSKWKSEGYDKHKKTQVIFHLMSYDVRFTLTPRL